MRRTILAVLLAALVAPQAATAAFFPAEVVDGPLPGQIRVGDVDISRDGTGGVVYTRPEGVFLGLLSDGAFAPPVKLDEGQGGTSSQPVIAASGSGRIAVAWVNDGSLYTRVRPKDQSAFTPPALVAQGGVSNPSIDMSINGATYLSYTQNGDVRVLRANRDDPNFAGLPAPVDVDVDQTAGTGSNLRSRVAVSADGTGLVVWGENGSDGRTHVYARRLFELRLSTAPQDLTLGELDGRPAGDAEEPEVDMEDDSSYAQVVFRHTTSAGNRVVMRRLVGSAFDPPQAADGGNGATRGRLDLNGRGEGLVAVSAGDQVLAGTLFNNAFSSLQVAGGANGIDPMAVAAIGENEDGAVSWFQGAGPGSATLRARYYDGVEPGQAKVEPEAGLSRPEFGTVDTAAGIDTAASRAGDIATVFVQSGGDGNRLVAGIYDKPPTRIAGSNSQSIRRLTRLRWAPSLNLLGPVTYRIVVDGQQVAETTATEWIPQPGQIRDGEHRWQIFLRDRRGQETRSRTRRLRVDNTPPLLSVSLSRRGRVLTVKARGRDSRGRLKSGFRRLVVDWGDRKLRRMGRQASKRYARGGRYTVRVKALDKAGNETVVTRRVRIGG